MYKSNFPSVGFIILAPEHNFGRLKSTKNSIANNYRNSPIICVVPKTTDAVDVEESQSLCPIYKGKDTITSLINTGFKHSTAEWNVIVMEGVWVHGGLDKKYSYFLESEKDIMFPIVTDYDIQGKPVKIYSDFWNCSLNGLMIHRKTFKKVGNFSDNPLEVSRLMWATIAQDCGCKFKAVLGVKIC